MPEILDIINMDDQVIGQATREEIYEKKLVFRVAHVMVRNSKWDFLFQRRAAHISSPLHWTASAWGHVHRGETYEEAAIRELAEEVWIRVNEVRALWKFFHDGNGLPKFIYLFEATSDDTPVFDPTEVDSVQFFTPEEAHEHVLHGEKIHLELKFLWEKLYTKKHL